MSFEARLTEDRKLRHAQHLPNGFPYGVKHSGSPGLDTR